MACSFRVGRRDVMNALFPMEAKLNLQTISANERTND
jgi:hypothetical protein